MLPGIQNLGPCEWQVPLGYVPGMRVPGVFYLSSRLAETLEEGAVRQLANVATMPGILEKSLAMPDIHWGYGFPIGGVAAFSFDDGVISPGGVGFDINCGVRLLATPLVEGDISNRRELADRLFREIPTGVGGKSSLRLSGRDLDSVLLDGASWAVSQGYGLAEDTEFCEEGGCMEGADPGAVSEKARTRGIPQSGTLGSGNHFLEVQSVREIYDKEAADVYGLHPGQVCIMIHCGSRGLGHQVCTDHLRVLESATKRYGITLPDRQLACAPLDSPEGRAYFGAMAASANYAWANRQVIMHHTRRVIEDLYGVHQREMRLVYDVAHNVAKIEEHLVGGKKMRVCVHRKGATRAFGPESPGIPSLYSRMGQPVIIPGSMGTPSFVLCGTETAMEKTFGSTCHGAGRVMSRTQARNESQARRSGRTSGRGASSFALRAMHPLRTRLRKCTSPVPRSYRSSMRSASRGSSHGSSLWR